LHNECAVEKGDSDNSCCSACGAIVCRQAMQNMSQLQEHRQLLRIKLRKKMRALLIVTKALTAASHILNTANMQSVRMECRRISQAEVEGNNAETAK
jgi:hypothetical protein